MTGQKGSNPYKTGFWYLASPYSKHPKGIFAAHHEACRAAALCFDAGIFVYAPIPHTHNIADLMGCAINFDHWKDFSLLMVERAEGVIVVKLASWERSIGVQAEIAYARELGKPVLFMEPDGPVPELPI